MYMHLQIQFKLKFHTRTASAPTKGHRLSNKKTDEAHFRVVDQAIQQTPQILWAIYITFHCLPEVTGNSH